MKTNVFQETHEILYIDLKVPSEIYCEVLTKLFNNKRDNAREFLRLSNYWNSNILTVAFDLTEYSQNNRASINDSVEHLKNWVLSMGTELKKIGNTYKEYNSTIEYCQVEKAVLNFYESIPSKENLPSIDIVD